jgi:hypothetical protein
MAAAGDRPALNRSRAVRLSAIQRDHRPADAGDKRAVLK